jgi:hypothetical protein
MMLMISPCFLYNALFFSFFIRSASYQTKVDDWVVPELLVDKVEVTMAIRSKHILRDMEMVGLAFGEEVQGNSRRFLQEL